MKLSREGVVHDTPSNGARPEPADKPKQNIQPAGKWNPQDGRRNMLPLYGRVKASADYDGAVELLSDPIDYVPRPPEWGFRADAGAVVIVGECMVPIARPGHVAYYDSYPPPNAGDVVVVQLKDGTGLIKEYVRKTAKELVLKQYVPEKEVVIANTDVKHLLTVSFIKRR